MAMDNEDINEDYEERSDDLKDMKEASTNKESPDDPVMKNRISNKQPQAANFDTPPVNKIVVDELTRQNSSITEKANQVQRIKPAYSSRSLSERRAAELSRIHKLLDQRTSDLQMTNDRLFELSARKPLELSQHKQNIKIDDDQEFQSFNVTHQQIKLHNYNALEGGDSQRDTNRNV